jgi:hypothetical protein
MAVTYVGIGTVASGTGAITPALPSGLADDDLLIAFFETANQAITLSGWTEFSSSPQGTGTAAAIGAVRLTAFYKFYTTGDSAPTSSDSGNHQIGQIMAFRGVDLTTPIEDTAGSTAAASNIQNLPTVTSTSADAMAVYLVADDRDIGTTNTQFRDTNWVSPNVDGGLCTEVTDVFTADGVGGGIGAAYKAVTTPATLSSATFQHAGTNSFANGMIAIVLKPVATGGSDEAPVGLSSEVDTALALARQQRADVSVAFHTATSFALAASQSRLAGLATETEIVFSLGSQQIKPVGLCVETDSSLALAPNSGSLSAPVELCVETETVFALARSSRRSTSVSIETETSFALARSHRRLISLATETETSLALGRAFARPVTLSLEIDTVPNAGAQVLPVGLCIESETVFALARQQRKALSVTITSELALAASRAYQAPVGRSDELSQAFGLNHAVAAPVGLCVELNTALALGKAQQGVIGLCVETSTAFARTVGSLIDLPETRIILSIPKETHTLFLNKDSFVLTQDKDRIELSL